MTDFQVQTDPDAFTMVWRGAALVLVLALVLVMERALFARGGLGRQRLRRESRVFAIGESLACAAE